MDIMWESQKNLNPNYVEVDREDRILWFNFSSIKDIYRFLGLINTKDDQGGGDQDFNAFKNKLFKPGSPVPERDSILAEIKKLATTKHNIWSHRDIPAEERTQAHQTLPPVRPLVDNIFKDNNRK